MAKKSIGFSPPVFDEKKYQAEQDVHMIKNMDELKKDKGRMGRAVKMASQMEKAVNKEAKVLGKIARKK